MADFAALALNITLRHCEIQASENFVSLDRCQWEEAGRKQPPQNLTDAAECRVIAQPLVRVRQDMDSLFATVVAIELQPSFHLHAVTTHKLAHEIAIT